MTDPKLCGHPWGVSTRSSLAVAVCVMLGCSGSSAEATREPDVSDTGVASNVFSVDASTETVIAKDASVGVTIVSADVTVPLDLVDAWTEGTTTGGSAWDASAWDGAATVVPLDSGPFEACLLPAFASSDTCAICETLDIASMNHMACNVDGLQCGVGCTLDCQCDNGTWTCAAPPCR